jgi:LacI family transcriptional regulator
MTPLSGTPRRSGRATLRDVAALAGVSLKTASRVVNGEAGVSPGLVVRVEDAARLLRYRPDQGARALRRTDRRTATIGLLLEDVENPYSAALHRAVEDAARARGVAVLAASVDETPERERELVAAFASRRVDGLIIMPASPDQTHLEAERRAGIPVVFVDRSPPAFEADSVVADNADGAAVATRHLLGAGHGGVAFLGGRLAAATTHERHAGYLSALAQAGVDVLARHVLTDLPTIDDAEDAASALLTAPDAPTALFTAQNLVTIGAIRALRRLGRHREVAVVGFDDFVLADLLDPAVTVVAQDPHGTGRRAAELLFRRVDGETGPYVHEVLPTRLIARGSGEIPPRVVAAADPAGAGQLR